MANPRSPATTLSFSSEGLIQMLIIQRSVIVTVKFPMNGQQWQTSSLFERRFAKESQPFTKMKGHGRIVKLGELCGLDLSMKVSHVNRSLGKRKKKYGGT